MTCFLCSCGTAIHYSSVRDEFVGCTGCLKRYAVDKTTGKLVVLASLEEVDLRRRDPLKMK